MLPMCLLSGFASLVAYLRFSYREFSQIMANMLSHFISKTMQAISHFEKQKEKVKIRLILRNMQK